MATTFERIASRIDKTCAGFVSDCHFSTHYALLRVGDELGSRLGFKRLSRWSRNRKDQWIQQYLKNNLSAVLNAYQHDHSHGSYQADAPIWVCWWTGIENAPALVKQCFNSIYSNARSHPVYLITKENYSRYIDIPTYILENVASGRMGLAHLADYLRVKLLATYGGLWLDATIFVSQQIPAECFDLPVFTCKGPVGECGYISEKRWVTFCLGGWKGNVFYRFLTDAFEHYWQINEYAIDYLFFDHIIFSAYEQIPSIRALLDHVPDNNVHRDDLQAAMNSALPASEMDRILHSDTALYKLSWRETYSPTDCDGAPSVYARFLDQ